MLGLARVRRTQVWGPKQADCSSQFLGQSMPCVTQAPGAEQSWLA